MHDLLGLSFIALAVVFTIWNSIYLYQYVTYRRIAPSAELTWLPRKPWSYNLCLLIGFFMVSLTAVSVFQPNRPMFTVGAQALMSLYYTVLFPLSFTIRRGLYSGGIWTEGGFVPYSRVRELNWIEKQEVVLRVRTESAVTGTGYSRLVVPGELFGQARRILAGHIEDHSLTVRKSILGLSESDGPAQEQV